LIAFLAPDIIIGVDDPFMSSRCSRCRHFEPEQSVGVTVRELCQVGGG
jgi:hypothetical protein